jgi:hypothetical protein
MDGGVWGNMVRLKRYGLRSDGVMPRRSACLRSAQLTRYRCSMMACQWSMLGDVEAEAAGLTAIFRQGREW